MNWSEPKTNRKWQLLGKWDSILKKGLTWPEPKTSRSEIVASWQTD